MIETRLRAADPARHLEPDADSAAAQSLLAHVLASPREGPRPSPARTARRSARRVAIGGVLAGLAAAVVLGVFLVSGRGGPGTTTSAYAVTTDGRGTVHVAVHWNRLSDPAALQAALDRAGARVKIRVLPTNEPDRCFASAQVVDYSRQAVQWQSPGSVDGGFTVRPDDFPAHATFVVTVTIGSRATPGASTFAPTEPQLQGFAASMVRNPLPACAR